MAEAQVAIITVPAVIAGINIEEMEQTYRLQINALRAIQGEGCNHQVGSAWK
jgi:hypothetical protein